MSAQYEVPQTQNTAPVIEFRCLYTTDITRKQKRWQDGRLRFHTFNKRIMVYDEKSNYVGDSHWRQDYEFGEGEELKLERGGTLVQVEEQMEIVNQDLSELLNKRHKEKEGRAAAMANASPNSMGGRVQNCGTPSSSLKPKSLNALLTPSGHHGRAVVSTTSPFEERQLLNNGNQDTQENNRPAKRRKPNESTHTKSGYAQNLTGTMLTLASSKPSSTPTIKYEPFNRPAVTHRPKATIDLTLDDDTESTGSIPAEPISREDMLQQRKERAKAHKMKRRRSPPPRSTYASNLTGVALSLNRPTPVPPKKVSNKVAPQIQADEYSDSSSSENTVEAQRPDPEPKKVMPKVKSASVRKTNPPRREPEKLARPTLDVDIAQTSSKPSRPLSDSPVGPDSRSVPDRPVSSLRIKARPPRKMMMLMDRSSSGPSCNRESVKKTGPKSSLNNSFSDVVEPPQSQATLRLEEYTRKQKESLQERLNGKRPRLNLDLDLDDMLSSPMLLDSPPDGEIDYQDIDRRLSQKSPSTGLMGSPPIQPIQPLGPSLSATRKFSDDGLARQPRSKIRVEDEFENGISDSEMVFDEIPKAQEPSSTSKLDKNIGNSALSKLPTPKSNTPPQPYTAKSPPLDEPSPGSVIPSQKISPFPTKPKDVFFDTSVSNGNSTHPFGVIEKPGNASEPTGCPKTNTPPKMIVPPPKPERANSRPKISDPIRTSEPDIPPRKAFAKAKVVLPNGPSLQDLFQDSDDESDHIEPNAVSKTDKVLGKIFDVIKPCPVATPTEIAQVMNMASVQPPELNEIEGRDGLVKKAPTLPRKTVKETDNPELQSAPLQSIIQAAKTADTAVTKSSSLIKKSPRGSSSPPKISPEALLGPIEHFRAIVPSSSTNTPLPSVEDTQERPPVADATSAVQPEPLVHKPIGSPREETVPDSVPLQEKENPELPEPIAPAVTPRFNPLPDIRPSNGAGFRFVHDASSTGQSSDNGSGGDLVLSIGTMKNNQPFKLTKPNPMIIMSSRPPVLAFSASKSNEGKRERRPVTETGPWSKESFDLFGEWGPLVPSV